MRGGKAGDGGGTIRELRLAQKGKKAQPKRVAKNPLRSGLRIERVPDPNIVVIFGANRLPQLGRGIGSAIRNFKGISIGHLLN